MDEKVNILVVDDLPDKRLAFEVVLEELGQNVVMADSGSAALRELLAREFAVILLDVNMPDIDGIETAELIRQHSKTRHTPIIFVTAYADEMQRRRTVRAISTEPFPLEIVDDAIRAASSAPSGAHQQPWTFVVVTDPALKRKIRDAGIPFRIPPRSEIGQRLDGVLAVVYLIFNEGHSATTGDELVRLELCREALRLARLLGDLHPCSASRGLLGLCLLIDARRPARVDAVGDLVLLDHQDRSLWPKAAIAEGLRFTELALRGDAPTHRYALEAAIAAAPEAARSLGGLLGWSDERVREEAARATSQWSAELAMVRSA